MKIKSTIFVLFTTVLLGCTKSQRVVNKLDGKWEIVEYRQTYINGLTSIIESTGTIILTDFDIKKEQKGMFQCDQYYTIAGSLNHLYENGSYYPNKKSDHLFVNITNPDGSTQTERDCSINILTSTDLKFQVVFNDIFHTYILRKK